VISSVFVLSAVDVVVASGWARHWLAGRVGVDRSFTVGLDVIRWPLTAALMMLGTAVAFHLLSDVRQKLAFMVPGAIVGTLIWLGATWAFTQSRTLSATT
jgi:uncharacterized BrkB/YihY/UPF0761 family membrane protein